MIKIGLKFFSPGKFIRSRDGNAHGRDFSDCLGGVACDHGAQFCLNYTARWDNLSLEPNQWFCFHIALNFHGANSYSSQGCFDWSALKD
jgi:hypothetical protein